MLPEEQPDEDRLLEERRRRRQAILDKYKDTPSPRSIPQPSAVAALQAERSGKQFLPQKVI